MINTKIYAGNKSVPYYDVTITDPLTAASTAKFSTPNDLDEMTMIHIIGDHEPFGGVIYKTTETQEGHEYEVMDFNRLLFGKMSVSYGNQTASEIILDLLGGKVPGEGIGINDGGVQKTTHKYPTLMWNNESIYNICHQLATLENREFYMTSNAVAVLRPRPQNDEGYVFFAPSVTDYSLVNDISNIVDVVSVFGKDNKQLKTYQDWGMINKYGYLEEILNEDSITSASAAVTRAKAEIAAQNQLVFSGSIKTPILPKMRSGIWIGYQPPTWSNAKYAQYYVQQVTTTINANTVEQQVDLLSGMPDPVSEWTYIDPTTGAPTPVAVVKYGTTTGLNVVTGAGGKTSGRDPSWMVEGAGHNYKTTVLNKCPYCGKSTIVWLSAKEAHYCNSWSWTDYGMFKCCTKLGGCDADWSIAGKEHKAHNWRDLHVISGPVATSAPINLGLGHMTTSQTTSDPVSILAHQLGSPKKIRDWVHTHIKYQLYYYPNPHYSALQTLQRKKGNCYDKNNLAAQMMKDIGYSASVSCGYICSGRGHCIGHVKINGRTIDFDTVCSEHNHL